MTVSNNHFWSLYFKTIIRPSRTFNLILKNEHRLKYGFFAFLIPAIGYSVFYYLAYNAGGAPSTFKPWLALPIEEYFRYDIFLSIPGILISLVIAAGMVQLLSHFFKGSGTFEETFIVFSFGSAIATCATILHDLTDAFLSYIHVIDMHEFEIALNTPTFWRSLWWTLAFFYLAGLMILFIKGVKSVHNTSSSASVVLGVTGMIAYQIILLIFIR